MKDKDLKKINKFLKKYKINEQAGQVDDSNAEFAQKIAKVVMNLKDQFNF